MGAVTDKYAIWAMLQAKPGKEADVAEFLKSAVPLVQAEPETNAWFAIQMGPATFGIFDTFAAESGREAHLAGKVAAALIARAPELLAEPPKIHKIDVLASKPAK
ncbi:MAG TPA: hypothetical protein VME86_01240 [Acidobacteriaceae bacterium]|nr:hypothetical protein [Acidobacteriaceae bacterium]